LNFDLSVFALCDDTVAIFAFIYLLILVTATVFSLLQLSRN